MLLFIFGLISSRTHCITLLLLCLFCILNIFKILSGLKSFSLDQYHMSQLIFEFSFFVYDTTSSLEKYFSIDIEYLPNYVENLFDAIKVNYKTIENRCTKRKPVNSILTSQTFGKPICEFEIA